MDKALAPEELYRCCEVSRLLFTRTDELAHESDIFAPHPIAAIKLNENRHPQVSK
ncbi:MAG: hypothetical protein KGZ35_04370 [Truepera sp.]|nr:hypothetical protein [Truepera sp.]